MPKLLQILVVALFVVPLLPLVLLVVLGWLLYSLWLNLLIWACWCSRSRNVLLVYSESPNWQEFIESELIPQLPKTTIILNWSQRRTWRWRDLSVRAFRHFGGDQEFNPMVTIFLPWRRAKSFRLYQPFRDYKHGNTEPLTRELQRLDSYLTEHGLNKV